MVHRMPSGRPCPVCVFGLVVITAFLAMPVVMGFPRFVLPPLCKPAGHITLEGALQAPWTKSLKG